MTQAGSRQLAAQEELPPNVRRAALEKFIEEHQTALAALRACAFTPTEARAMENVQ